MFNTTRQILTQIKTFHSDLGTFYTDAAEQVETGRVGALLRFMGDHERYMRECLDRYEQRASRKVLDSWFQFSPVFKASRQIHKVEVDPEMSVGDVVNVALDFDDRLMKFVHNLADQSKTGDVRQLFENLAEIEEQEKHKASRAALEILEGV